LNPPPKIKILPIMPKCLNPKSQRGSVLLMILAGIATLGVLAMMGSTLLTTMISGNQRSSLSITTGQTLTQAAYTLTTEADKTGSYPVATAPTAWSGTTPSTAPVIGTANAVGLIPATSAAPKVDAWGSNFGYCTFTAVAQGNPVFAVISAGPDKVFQTTCTQAFAGTAQGDDGVRWKTATNVLQGVGGTVFFGDPVANLAALEALTTARPGETRVAKDSGISFVNKTGTAGAGNWQSTRNLPNASDGSNCNYPTDTVARNATGSLLSCQQPILFGVAQPATWKRQDACVPYSNNDLNALEIDGCFSGVNMTNSPSNANWFFVESFRHLNSGNYYVMQRATCLNCAGNVPIVWERIQQSATIGIGWGVWQKQMNTYGNTNSKVLRDFACFTTAVQNNTAIHIKTNIPKASTVMYRLLFEGYNYGTAQDINAAAAGYTYAAVPNSIYGDSIANYAGGGILSQYISSDGFVTVRMTNAVSFYYAGFCVSAFFANPLMPTMPISATFFQQSTDL
jgi:hypothetical protein